MNIEEIFQKTQNKQDFFLVEENIHAAILVLCMDIQGVTHFIFQKRAAHISNPREIGFPGGKVEKTDTSIKDAVIRETMEEMGLSKHDFMVSHKLFRLQARGNLILDIFIGKTHLTSLDGLQYNPDEVEAVFTLPANNFIGIEPIKHFVKSQIIIRELIEEKKYEYFPDLNETYTHQYNKDIWEQSDIPIYVYNTQYGPIWGITAHILYMLSQMIQTDSVLSSI